jgi:S1-C subfamily serine protease
LIRPHNVHRSEAGSWRGAAIALLLTAAVAVVGAVLVILAFARSNVAVEDGAEADTATATVQPETTTEAATTPAPQSTVTTAAPVSMVVTGLTDVSDVAADAVESVVRVETTASFRGYRQVVVASGSGVIVESSGMIVTNAHVVGSGESVIVTLNSGTTYDATVIGVDTDHDLAVIRIDADEELDAFEFGSSEAVQVGDPVIAIGYPLGLEGDPSVSTGIVSAKDRTITDSSASLSGIIQTDAAITEGSSGGALLDAEGRLIGITTAVGVSSVGIEGIGFAIPVETVEEVLPTLVDD